MNVRTGTWSRKLLRCAVGGSFLMLLISIGSAAQVIRQGIELRQGYLRIAVEEGTLRWEAIHYRSSDGRMREETLASVDGELIAHEGTIAIPGGMVYRIDFTRGIFCTTEFQGTSDPDPVEYSLDEPGPDSGASLVVEQSSEEPSSSVFLLPEGLTEVSCETLGEPES